MSHSFVKKTFLFISLFAIVSLACDMTVNISPSTATSPASLPTNTLLPTTAAATQVPFTPTSIPATLAPVATSTPPALEGMEVAVSPLRIIVPPHLASGVRGLQFPRAEGDEVVPWELDPGHVQLKLEGYLLQDKLHEPQIYVFPAQAYAEMYSSAFESIRRIDNMLYSPGGPALNDQLPFVPFFNAAQVFASNAELISFQGGQGVRFITEYAQYTASANNHDLLYEFEGVTRDGTYYIVAILPITAPELAETSDAGAPLPPGGVPYPYFADPDADMQVYYRSVVDVLNATPPEAFNPSISQLDVLIQSMRINP